MLDVDHFKQINDVQGHAAGDRVLAGLAQSCREHIRSDDIAGRYGGDEFILVISGISSLRAIQIAARRRLLAALRGHRAGRGPLSLTTGTLTGVVKRLVRPPGGGG